MSSMSHLNSVRGEASVLIKTARLHSWNFITPMTAWLHNNHQLASHNSLTTHSLLFGALKQKTVPIGPDASLVPDRSQALGNWGRVPGNEANQMQETMQHVKSRASVYTTKQLVHWRHICCMIQYSFKSMQLSLTPASL